MTKIPLATYRLQMNKDFTFKALKDILPYLQVLGISHVYLSSILMAKAGSQHGYDVVDPSKINPEIGTEEEFIQLVAALKERQMGVILDIVPNHLYILDAANSWWMNVLENGPSSPYSKYFDIDWKPPRARLKNKVLLPLLEQQYGEALEKQSLQVVYANGAFFIDLDFIRLPTDPHTWVHILTPIVEGASHSFKETDITLLELKSILTAIEHLPSVIDLSGEKIEERQREKEIIKHRLEGLVNNSEILKGLLQNYLKVLNGSQGDMKSFDALEQFTNEQPYRLSYWRVANDEINYRRFFDVCPLAGIRTESDVVFNAIHQKIFELIQDGLVDGLRIDHIDGLIDPQKYLDDLHAKAKKPCYIIAEKILTGAEKLCPEWKLQGTVGYDFLNDLNGLFIQKKNQTPLYETYRKFTRIDQRVGELAYMSKKIILMYSMSSELHVLSRILDRIAEQHRSTRDFTEEGLKSALRDVIACFPVYRSYIRAFQNEIHPEDEGYISHAIAKAKRHNPTFSDTLFDFIHSVLLLKYPEGLDEDQKDLRRQFVMRFQQLTGPIAAKGIEDTLFYRFFPLASNNEVGSDPQIFGIAKEVFHKKNQERQKTWPHSLLSTSTHDTKRSEDVRARLNVLSEIPVEWDQALLRWHALNQQYKVSLEEGDFPDPNDEYLLYQTLVGSWPFEPFDSEYVDRIVQFMIKAGREAKMYTSWINPNIKDEETVKKFVQNILENGSAFLIDFKAFMPKIQAAGMMNALAQVALKLMSPGVPDIYQGNERWEFKLVDPDNRLPVDYKPRQKLLTVIRDKKPSKELINELLARAEDGGLKMYVTAQLLALRQRHAPVANEGIYMPLEGVGERENHLVTFARSEGDNHLVVLTGRFFASLVSEDKPYLQGDVWQDTAVALPAELQNKRWKSVLTGEEFAFEKSIPAGAVLDTLPVAVLERLAN